MEIGPIEGPEVPACAGIFFDAMNDLHRRTNVPPEDPADDSWLRHALRHFLRTDPHRTALVRSQEHPIAFGTAYRRERFWFLAFLFVRPGSQASGVGRAIIEHLLPDAHERVEITLATMVESFQPVSTGLYARFGMAPRTPRYRLTGVRSLEALPALPEDVLVEPMTAARIEACGELDRTLLGYRRPQDHAWWLETDATAVAYLSGSGALIGYGYMDEEGYIGPVASGDQLLTSAIVRDLLGRLPSPEAGKLSVFGSSGVLLARLLDAGLRIGDEHGPAPFIYCSNDGAKPEPSYVGYSGYLV